MRSPLRLRSSVLAACTLAACSTKPTVPVGEAPEGYTVAASISPRKVQDIDLLFVIDNSGSMLEEQQALNEWAQRYVFGTLELESGVMPNLHIGVVSTNLGAGGYRLSNCDGDGDGGRFLNQPRIDGCTPPNGPFIRDVALPDGTRDRNYTGSLSETFTCIASLGNQGCGYEQPLESMRRALTSPDGTSFLRPNALLAVVFLTDEDDCSVTDTAMFDPSQNALTDPLGPLSSFRCFEFGVTCDQEDLRQPGVRTNCQASGSAYMDDVQPYIDFLYDLKGDPSMVVVAGIIGPSSPIEVALEPSGDNTIPFLNYNCSGTYGTQGSPAIRMHDFLAGFPGRSQEVSICADDLEGPLQSITDMIRGVAGRGRCLRGPIADGDPAVPGIQPDCRVFEVVNPGTSSEARTELPACTDGMSQRCFQVEQDAASCALTDTQLAVVVPDTQAHLMVECRAAEAP